MRTRASVLLEAGPRITQRLDEGRQERSEPAVGCPFWQRTLDVMIVALLSPVWLPLMILIACGIKIVSPGCVFFFQERVGYRGRSFKLFKFRSMKINAETET
ncbi:MAG TPA: sugar transferase, partial [Chthoniobacteraceae bacterium]|nr:sugar transferase [Chthoniobacteraceae bacterium]